MIALKVLRWKDFPAYLGVHKSSYKGKSRESMSEKDEAIKPVLGVMYFEDEGRDSDSSKELSNL